MRWHAAYFRSCSCSSAMFPVFLFLCTSLSSTAIHLFLTNVCLDHLSPRVDCLLVDAALMRNDANHHLDIIDSTPSLSHKRGHGDMMGGGEHAGSMMEGEEDPLALMEAEQAGPNSLLMQGLAGN